jgi:DNA invertase Pin-like site-specific DNA recombinase
MPPRKTPPQNLPTSAIALVRISADPDGRAVGVGRQEEDCRALAIRLGWTIGEVVVENDTSAYSTKATTDADGLPTRTTKRPEFRRALKMLHAGKSDGLIVYDIDRLARQPRDLEALIDLAEVHGTPVQAVTGSLDVSNSAGRAMARVLMAMANKSSEDTGRRVARAARQRAEQGTPKSDGFRPYGYDRDMVIIPAEADIIREVAERILLGDAIRSICTDLNARNVPTARGGSWYTSAVKSIVTKPTVAAARAYQGDVVADGSWEPILDRDTWVTVCGVIDRKRSASAIRDTAGKHLLSGIATCGPCGARLYVGTDRRGVQMYRCVSCHRVSRKKEWLDEYVTAVVEELLNRGEVRAARGRRGSRPRGTAATLEALRERRRQLLRRFATDLAAADLDEMLAAIDERIALLVGEEVSPAVNLPSAADFAGLPPERKRAITARLVRVEVLPAPSRGQHLDPDSVRVTPAY